MEGDGVDVAEVKPSRATDVVGTWGDSTTMSDAIWLVDYENVQTIDLAHVPINARLKVFIGSKQNMLPT